MSQNSYPKVDSPFTDDQWKQLFLTLGRGIIDRGGSPYSLTARDSVTNTVTIGVTPNDGQTDGRNFAVLDGFLHTMDSPEQVSVPAVTTDTTYEIGLVYDPTKHGDENGPITLTSWVAPGDNTGGKSRLVFYRMTRKANLALGSTPYTSERPCAVPTFSVSTVDNLPTNSLVLVDSIALVRTTGQFYRASVASNGTVSWTQVGGATQEATARADPNTVMLRDTGGRTNVATPTTAEHATNKAYVDNGLDGKASTSALAGKAPLEHMHYGSDMVKNSSFPIPWEIVTGSTSAYSNTNVGSTWASVVARNNGQFGRYPSALKYKKNVREWKLTPDTAYGITPVKYEDKENGDTRVGVVADSYVNSLPELVETNPETGEVEGWKYMLMCVAQQVAIRDLNDRVKALEAMLTDPGQNGGA